MLVRDCELTYSQLAIISRIGQQPEIYPQEDTARAATTFHAALHCFTKVYVDPYLRFFLLY